MTHPKRKYPPERCLEEIKGWCDRRERCQTEVQRKLASWGVPQVERDAIVTELIGHGYVNEERFARAFSRGHVRIKKWGWAKIEAHLKALHISAPNIEAAREEADAEATPDVLQGLILRKLHTLKDKNLPERDLRAKLYRYALSRGYSHQQATEAIQAAIQH